MMLLMYESYLHVHSAMILVVVLGCKFGSALNELESEVLCNA